MEYLILFLSIAMVTGAALYSVYSMDDKHHDKKKAHHQ